MGTQIMNVLLTPEVVVLLLTLSVALLVKSKLLTEQDIARARAMLWQGRKLTEVTDETRLKINEVKQIVTEKEPIPAKDSARKKVQRAARAILRGWLRF